MDRREKISRYDRQVLLPQIGAAGQSRLARARVLLVGCGALGTVTAEQLVRAGVGYLRICDRDIVEETNLQRQVLFDESDGSAGTPKAIAARDRLVQINSTVEIDANVVDIHSANIERLMESMELIVDGTDNVETRYLLNDAAVKNGIPWVYGACVGTEGRVMAVVPGKGPCLRCLFDEPPGVGELATCDTAGVLAPAANVTASLQVTLALKILLDEQLPDVARLITFDIWHGRFKKIDIADARRDNCPCCGRQEFTFLNRPDRGMSASLCGRNAVQIRPAISHSIEFKELSERLKRVGEVWSTEHLLKCRLTDTGHELTVFRDGRVLVHGTSDVSVARGIYGKFVGG